VCERDAGNAAIMRDGAAAARRVSAAAAAAVAKALAAEPGSGESEAGSGGGKTTGCGDPSPHCWVNMWDGNMCDGFVAGWRCSRQMRGEKNPRLWF